MAEAGRLHTGRSEPCGPSNVEAGPTGQELLDATAKGLENRTLQHVRQGADVNARNEKGGTPLMFFVASDHNAEAVKALIGAGADVNARDRNGVTALILACKRGGSEKVVDALLAAGANPLHESASMGTPLYNAACQKSGDATRALIADRLILRGADVNTKGRDGLSPPDPRRGLRPCRPDEDAGRRRRQRQRRGA